MTLNVLLTVAVNANVTLTSSITSSVNAGQPVQGNMSQLALARWNYMSPS
jgi:hypothetical protein